MIVRKNKAPTCSFGSKGLTKDKVKYLSSPFYKSPAEQGAVQGIFVFLNSSKIDGFTHKN